MEIPSESSPVVDSLRNSLIACATFQLLVDASDAAEASAFVKDGFVDDEEDEEGNPADVFPRAILDDSDVEQHEVLGPGNISGDGRLGIYIQFEQLTDEELEDWYDGAPGFTSGGEATLRNHRLHCRNLYRKITRELEAVARTPGCIEMSRLVPRGCGLEDPVNNNKRRIWAMEWDVYWRGTP